jgi:hypothetical protein
MSNLTAAALVWLLVCGLLLALCGCQGRGGAANFGDDLAFLRRNTPLILLSDARGQAQVAIAPEYQGRVMTSTAAGAGGLSFGWINRPVIEAHRRQPHMNVFGGEERLWLGPEGGQFSLYFEAGEPFDLEHWQVPEAIDWGAWDVGSATPRSASFWARCALVNYSGATFDLRLDRTVRLLDRAQAQRLLGADLPPALDVVAYESDNQVTNTGARAWSPETGLISIWLLCMYNPSPATTVVIPFKPGAAAPEEVVNDAYFGKVPPDRLAVDPRAGILFFKCDGLRRSKIGIRPAYALPVCGSYDAANRVLTIVRFSLQEGEAAYVNSMWELQADPFGGDVVNSYNDGPPEGGGKPLGPFYELESSSAALRLEPGATGRHVQQTFHLQGSRAALDEVSRRVLRTSLDAVEGAFAR